MEAVRPGHGFPPGKPRASVPYAGMDAGRNRRLLCLGDLSRNHHTRQNALRADHLQA